MQLFSEIAWTNPFLAERAAQERRIVGTRDFRPLTGGAARGAFSPNMEVILRKAVEELERQRSRGVEDERSYDELVAFVAYHELLPVLDPLVFGSGNGRRAWRSCRELAARWELPQRRTSPWIGLPELFSFAYQVRRAFHWIYRYVIGDSHEADRLRGRIWQSIFGCDLRRYFDGFYLSIGQIPTLITGPSGSGKELVARAIGMSRFIPFDPVGERFPVRPEETFLAVNLAAVTANLAESELFGHAKGSFTGAYQERAGYFETAGPFGSVFLDEIGESEGTVQAKLLRVLQNGTFRRVGENLERKAEGKVIAATNRDPERAVEEGTMREDLYFRLNSDRLCTLGLKELIGTDPARLEPMLRYIIGRLLKGAEEEVLVAEMLTFIETRLGTGYEWPGNFRELEQFVRNFMIHRDYQPVRLAPRDKRDGDGFWDRARRLELDSGELLGGYTRQVVAAEGSQRAAAARLGVDPRTVRKWLGENGKPKSEG